MHCRPLRSASIFILTMVWLLVAAGVPAFAQATWQELSRASIDTRRAEHVIKLPNNEARTSALRLEGTTRDVSITRLEVTYTNGRVEFIEVPFVIRAQVATPLLFERPTGAIVDEIVLRLAADSAGGTTPLIVSGRDGPRMTARRGILPSPGPNAEKDAGAKPDGSTTTGRSVIKPYKEVGVHFATVRQRERDRTKNEQTLATFGGTQVDTTTYGYAVVTVPTEGRQPGTVPRPTFDFVLNFRREDPASEFTLASVKTTDATTFQSSVGKQSREAQVFKRQALVFVHGFRVTFDDALYHAAQIVYDIGFDGPAVVFSWASRGNALSYFHDKSNAKESAAALKDLLASLARNPDLDGVNVVAHSMGNEPLVQVLTGEADILAAGGRPALRKLNELVFAAPDVGRDVFNRLTGRLTGMARGATLYVSDKDWALSISGSIANPIDRAGFVPRGQPPLILRGVETIDLSEAGWMFGLQHSTFSDRRHILDDLKLLFSTGKRPPNDRFLVFRPIQGSTGLYWKYR